jgi:hypothetical protein
VVHRYSLPHLTVEGQHLLRCRPYMLALNCNASKMSIIDINGVLSFYDLSVRGSGSTQGEHLSFERKVSGSHMWVWLAPLHPIGGFEHGPAHVAVWAWMHKQQQCQLVWSQ